MWEKTKKLLRCIPDDISGCEDSVSEFDNLCTPELEADYSFCDESDQDILSSVHFSAHLPDRPTK